MGAVGFIQGGRKVLLVRSRLSDSAAIGRGMRFLLLCLIAVACSALPLPMSQDTINKAFEDKVSSADKSLEFSIKRAEEKKHDAQEKAKKAEEEAHKSLESKKKQADSSLERAEKDMSHAMEEAKAKFDKSKAETEKTIADAVTPKEGTHLTSTDPKEAAKAVETALKVSADKKQRAEEVLKRAETHFQESHDKVQADSNKAKAAHEKAIEDATKRMEDEIARSKQNMEETIKRVDADLEKDKSKNEKEKEDAKLRKERDTKELEEKQVKEKERADKDKADREARAEKQAHERSSSTTLSSQAPASSASSAFSALHESLGVKREEPKPSSNGTGGKEEHLTPALGSDNPWEKKFERQGGITSSANGIISGQSPSSQILKEIGIDTKAIFKQAGLDVDHIKTDSSRL